MIDRMLREREVLAVIGISRALMWLQVKEGEFIPPVKIGARAVAWPESEVGQMIRARIAGKSQRQIKALVKKISRERA